MVIAVDTRGNKEYQHFIYRIFKIIIAKHPKHTFILISGKPLEPSFTFSDNIISIEVKQAKFPLLSQIRMSSLLKNNKADVFITAQTWKTNVPQVLIALDKTATRSLKSARIIMAPSAFFKKEIIEKYKIGENKIEVVYKSVDDIYTPLAFDQREKIKEQYAGGKDYYLCTGKNEPGNLLGLLKAFSVFKKMQKSNMQLLIVHGTEIKKEFSEALQHYKFKSEVKVLQNISSEESAKIIAGAYAIVYPFVNEGYLPVLQAIKCNVPVITSSDEDIIEVCSDAALYFNHHDYKDIADKMMIIFKDENLKQQLIKRGIEQVKKYSLDNSADTFWKGIKKAVH